MDEQTVPKIAVVTDSTSDLPAALASEYGVRVIPQILILGGRTWRDGVDIDSATFYDLLRTSQDFFSTSQASAADFQALFSDLATRFEGIAAILVSNELSGTLNSARMAAAALPEIPVEIVDSRSTSMGLGFITLAAARTAMSGGDLTAVAEAARQMIERVHVVFVVDTLEYLHRGGRIGAAARLVGSALDLKPVLEIKDGIVTPVTRVRTRRRALDKLLELVSEQVGAAEQCHMAVLHVAAPEEAEHLGMQLKERFAPVELIQAECGPVIGAHAGPGTLGVAVYVDDARIRTNAAAAAQEEGG